MIEVVKVDLPSSDQIKFPSKPLGLVIKSRATGFLLTLLPNGNARFTFDSNPLL